MAIEMALTELEDRIADIVNDVDKETFIFDFMREMGLPKATVTKLQKGQKAANIATVEGDIWSNKNVYFRKTEKDVLSELMDVQNIVKSKSGNQPRIILVTDFQRLVALDTKISDTLDINFLELPQNFDFFLPWQGRERVEFEVENPADIKAAERFAKIYDVLFKDNTEIINVKEKRKTVARHVFTENTVSETAFNNFLIRILFALFAEDTDIFPRGAFTSVIKKMTDEDGSDMNMILRELFGVLDKPENVRGTLANWLSQFPYVNGSLFTEPHEDIVFSAKSRKLIIDAGELIDWTQVNPDIFGSMVQAVTGEDDRSHLGMHYTSVPNIMKVIKPLFLDDLNNEFELAYNDDQKLDELGARISRMKFFDPAAGSGNFLIITYKELRRLEIRITKRLSELQGSMFFMYMPLVTLKQFYGIEIEQFAAEAAQLSLWIAEHQMNLELTSTITNAVRPTLPLQKAGGIYALNSLRVEWTDLLDISNDDELYVFGNPPYLGKRKQKPQHVADLEFVFGDTDVDWKKLDYISGWFYKAAQLTIQKNVKVAFVTTNSVVQGEQVFPFWSFVFGFGNEIQFAYLPFKWGNNAKGQAGVTVVVIGLWQADSKMKRLYDGQHQVLLDNISPYLTSNSDVMIRRSSKPMNSLHTITSGSRPYSTAGMVINRDEYDVLNESDKFLFKAYVGGKEFIDGFKRYVLWNVHESADSNIVREMLDNVPASSKKGFTNVSYRDKPGLFIPQISSENYYAIPMGPIDAGIVVADPHFIIYDFEPWEWAVLQSRMHRVWTILAGGKLESRLRYSSELIYNTFPVPPLSKQAKNRLEELIMDVYDIRNERGLSLNELYGSGLPQDLKKAHERLDEYVDRLYTRANVNDDEKRATILLSMYEDLLNEN